jgi:hypothetical protein
MVERLFLRNLNRAVLLYALLLIAQYLEHAFLCLIFGKKAVGDLVI